MITDEESVSRIGKILLKALENTTPTYRREEIQDVVERIYRLAEKNSDADLKKEANDICNAYGGRRGVHFLRELFDKNNS